jgi:hypothetical protein
MLFSTVSNFVVVLGHGTIVGSIRVRILSIRHSNVTVEILLVRVTVANTLVRIFAVDNPFSVLQLH